MAQLTFLTQRNRARGTDKMDTQRCLSTMKDLVKVTARDISQRDVGNIPDTDLKAMIIRILTGVVE